MANDGGSPDPAGRSGALDRRSLLRKAAAAGVASWVAPVVLSRSAHAQGSGTGTLVARNVGPGPPIVLSLFRSDDCGFPGGTLLEERPVLASDGGTVSFTVTGGLCYYVMSSSIACGAGVPAPLQPGPVVVPVGGTVDVACIDDN